MAGSTSGEIFGDLRHEFERLVDSPLRNDPDVGAILSDAYTAVGEALEPSVGRRWQRRRRP
jgi:hypothetical protein